VNLSPRQFRQKDLVKAIEAILLETRLPARCLELEITETTIMHSTAHTIGALHELTALGVRISVDDFGTGYSSLAYLHRFPVHKLKIDQSFVRGIPADAEDAAIARAIISLGHGLKLRVNAEGVENADQLRYLRAEQCDEIQGFHLCRPIAADAVAVFVAGGGAGPAASSERPGARAGTARARR
jgi:EAL domain-containing protein (putative c-di-GMP-specific phosphodiesterase class I)